MNILGLHLGHDASAALIKDNRIVSLVERERLTRIKYDRGFMPELIDKALGDLRFKDLDYVTVSLCAGTEFYNAIHYSDLWGLTIKRNGEKYNNGPRNMDPWDCEDGITVKFDGVEKPAFQVQHHVAHAAASFYTSGFDKAISLTYDGSGLPENQTSLLCKCEGNRIETVGSPCLNGALLYASVCKFMYGSWRDSGKLMGLSAYGKPTYFHQSYLDDPTILSMLDTLNKEWTKPEEWKEIYAKSWKEKKIVNIAASTQTWMEKDTERALDYVEKYYGKEVPIVIGGGGALNVLANRIIYDRHPLFSVPFVKDDGMAIGGPLYILHHVLDVPRETYTMKDLTFLGQGKDDWERWESYEWNYSTQIHTSTENKLARIAKFLSEGKVVLWHQDRSEAGPRALTHRSIFAKANGMKKRVSEDIKGREEYRPLAPIVLDKDCTDWFDVSPNPLTEIMLLNAKVKQKDKIPDVTHVDGTARVQTISKEFNPIVYNLLEEYKKITGVPVLINTSLNIQGQAICETERDTMWTFDNCDADVCVINNNIYLKEGTKKHKKQKVKEGK